MDDLLYKYMNERFHGLDNESEHHSGPVLTISRAAGCPVNQLAKDIVTRLNELTKKHQWEVVSKEILHQSAEIMRLHPEKLKTIFEVKNRSFFEEIIQAFVSDDYHLEKRMVKTVSSVIHNFGIKGHKIIIGRGAGIICADIPHSLHIRLEAPLSWRIDRVKNVKKLTTEEAAECISNTDKNRENFKKLIKGDLITSEMYDLIINQAAFAPSEIVEIILQAMKFKKLI